LQLHLYLKLRSKSKPWNAIPIHYPAPSLRATVAYPTALLTLLPCPNGLPISNSFSYGYSCSPYGVSYSAASPEFLNNDQTPPLPAIAALLPALLILLLLLSSLTMTKLLLLRPLLLFLRPYLLSCFLWMPYQYLTPSHSATAVLSYGPTYSAASPECLTNISYSYCCPLLWSFLLCCFPWMPYQ